eukprot:6213737-Pleurochrysis_carterae.AAC.1
MHSFLFCIASYAYLRSARVSLPIASQASLSARAHDRQSCLAAPPHRSRPAGVPSRRARAAPLTDD